MNYNQDVTDYIHAASDDQVKIMEILRDLIHQSADDISEAIKWKMPVFAAVKDFAYLRKAKNHITLGFYNIERIKDPDNLLEGSGSTLKHIKIKKKEDINSELLVKWFKAISG